MRAPSALIPAVALLLAAAAPLRADDEPASFTGWKPYRGDGRKCREHTEPVRGEGDAVVIGGCRVGCRIGFSRALPEKAWAVELRVRWRSRVSTFEIHPRPLSIEVVDERGLPRLQRQLLAPAPKSHFDTGETASRLTLVLPPDEPGLSVRVFFDDDVGAGEYRTNLLRDLSVRPVERPELDEARAAQIDGLIARLSAADVRDRDAAAEELSAAGLPAVEAVRRLLRSDEAARREAARSLVEAWRTRIELVPGR